jgi:hypothetical protein
MLNRQWQQIQSLINNVNSKPINYDSTVTSFLIDLFIKQPTYFEGAYNFLFGIYDIRSRDSFIGAVIAYEFTVKDITEITGRKEHERKSINRLKSDFIEYVKKSEEAYLNNINEAESLFSKYSESIDELRNTKEADFDEWFEKTKNEGWQKWFEEKVETLKKLEETYETKLKLEKPAKYWSKKSYTYYLQGDKAKKMLFCIIGISCAILTLI